MKISISRTRRLHLAAALAAVAVAGTGTAFAGLGDPHGAARHDGDQTAEVAAQVKYGKAKNVILFVGDGMGDSEITIARNYLVGASGRLPGIDSLPLTGQYTTYALHKDGPYAGKPDYVTDSAASGSGWATGTKTYNGAISVGLDGRTTHQSLLEWAKSQGLKTGDVTTAEIQDATPAVQYAHVAERACYAPAGSKGMAKCPDQILDDAHPNGLGSISEQLLRTKPDVTLGGGRKYFDELIQGGPDKGRSVRQAALDKGFRIVESAGELAAVTTADQSRPLLGLFADGNLNTRFKATPATKDGYRKAPAACATNDSPAWPGNQPTLAAMTGKAIELLDGEKGFFLQVEGASIDKQDHSANACGQIGETKDLDEAVEVGMDFAKKHGDTLVIVTADHAHTSQIINGEDISTGSDDPTVNTSIPLAATYNLLTTEGAPMLVAYGTAQLGGSQQHTGTQLRVAGYGPGAANVVGLSDQTDLFATIKGALSGVGLDKAPAGRVVHVPTPVPGVACTKAPQLTKALRAELKQARHQHRHQRVVRLQARLAGVKALARFC